MKKSILLVALIAGGFAMTSSAQQYFTKNGNVSFFSKTNMEDIKADNNQVMSVLDSKTGGLQFSLLNKGFHFDKALMEEHFNENYMESNKFPKSTFKGTIADISKIDLTKDGVHAVTVTGDMTMHGVTKSMTTTGTITVKGGKVNATAKFIVKLADYNIAIPSLVKKTVPESMPITVNCDYSSK